MKNASSILHLIPVTSVKKDTELNFEQLGERLGYKFTGLWINNIAGLFRSAALSVDKVNYGFSKRYKYTPTITMKASLKSNSKQD